VLVLDARYRGQVVVRYAPQTLEGSAGAEVLGKVS
jgi:hypothetical protein